MRKNMSAKLNKIVSMALAIGLVVGLAACGNKTGNVDTSEAVVSEGAENTETGQTEPDTVATIIEVADIIEDENGNILDAVSLEKLTDEEIEKKIAEGKLKKDKSGKLSIVQDKNTRKAAITIDAKTNEIITAEAADGKTYIIDDGKITAPKNEGNVKVEVKTSDKRKAEVKVSTAEDGDEKKTTAERKTVEVTTEEVAKVTTEEQRTESKSGTEKKTEEKQSEIAKKTEEITERATEKKTESTTQQKAENTTQSRTEQKTEAKTEKKTEAQTQQRTEQKTEARTQATTQATTQARTEQKTEARTQATTQATTQARTEATTQAKTEPTTQKKTEAPVVQKTEAPACSHTWVWHTHTETVHKSEKYLVSDAWDEPVYESHSICNGCGTDLTANYGGATTSGGIGHLDSCGTGYHNGNVQVGTVHHDAVYETDEWDEYEEVNDYQYCSKCGERK